MAISPSNVHLHCAQCDAQLGIFENEWVHLTPSYARPKERGINMGCRIGSKTQVVPHGPTQKEAAGCTMVELFCEKCSSIVGQSCKTTPSSEQQNLLNQRFFKLSRIYLTDVKDERREDPVFVDTDNYDNPSRSTSVRSVVAPVQRALSRGGATPSFRQSYPPPSSQTLLYDQYQEQRPMPPPRHSFPQKPPSPVLLHYPPPSNNYPYSQHVSRQQSDMPEQYQPLLTNPVPDLQQEVKGQGVSISECFNRVAAAERRLASEETRALDAERRSIDIMEKMQKSEAHTISLVQRVQHLETDRESQATSLVKSQETQQDHNRLITTQAEQIAALTEKLGVFQATIEELKTQMADIRSESLIGQNPRPDSHDFLGNLEVMVKAMRSATTQEREIQSLREKNNAMKARLGTIFAAMGSVSEEDTALLEDHASQQNVQHSPILGKRKRTSDARGEEVARLAKRILSPDIQDKSLPTPESTQAEKLAWNNSQPPSNGSEADLTLQEGTSLLNGNPRSRGGNNIVDLAGSADNDQATAAVSERRTARTPSGNNDCTAGPEDNREDITTEILHEKLEERSAPPDIHQAHAVNGDSLHSLPQHDNQHAFFLRGSSGHRDFSIEPVISPHQSRPLNVSRSQHPAPGYGRMGSSSCTQHPAGNPSYFNTPPLPPVQAHHLAYVNVDSQTRSWKRDETNEERTFSHALSRGHRLEDIIQRPSRQSSVLPSDEPRQRLTSVAPKTHEGTAGLNPVVQPGQMALSLGHVSQQSQAQLNRHEAGNKTHHPQVIEFSDEENVGQPVVKSTHPQDKQTLSNTPTVNGRPHLLDRASYVRTIRELTQEPLRRPVIKDPSPVAHIKPHRGATHVQQQSMLPSFATAIHNLNDSAARHVATSTPRSSKSGAVPRSRVSESVPPVCTNTKADRETVAVASERQPETETPLSGSSATKPSGDSQLPKPRGRPRKTSTTLKIGASSGISNSENDDNCALCKRRGKLLCCDGCPRSYHHRCLNMDAKQPVEGDWFCPECTTNDDRSSASDTIIVRPLQDNSVMMMRRKLAEEAMARDMARKN